MHFCNYYYFVTVNFRFYLKECAGCHDLMQKAIRFKNVEIASLKRYDSLSFLSIYEKLILCIKTDRKIARASAKSLPSLR